MRENIFRAKMMTTCTTLQYASTLCSSVFIVWCSCTAGLPKSCGVLSSSSESSSGAMGSCLGSGEGKGSRDQPVLDDIAKMTPSQRDVQPPKREKKRGAKKKKTVAASKVNKRKKKANRADVQETGDEFTESSLFDASSFVSSSESSIVSAEQAMNPLVARVRNPPSGGASDGITPSNSIITDTSRKVLSVSGPHLPKDSSGESHPSGTASEASTRDYESVDELNDPVPLRSSRRESTGKFPPIKHRSALSGATTPSVKTSVDATSENRTTPTPSVRCATDGFASSTSGSQVGDAGSVSGTSMSSAKRLSVDSHRGANRERSIGSLLMLNSTRPEDREARKHDIKALKRRKKRMLLWLKHVDATPRPIPDMERSRSIGA